MSKDQGLRLVSLLAAGVTSCADHTVLQYLPQFQADKPSSRCIPRGLGFLSRLSKHEG